MYLRVLCCAFVAGTGAEPLRTAFGDKAERSAGSAVDAGHLDMGNLRVNSTTTPQPSAQSASGPRRATIEPHLTAPTRVRSQHITHFICNMCPDLTVLYCPNEWSVAV